MALRDYILCADGECKLLYDGNDSGREWLEERFGEPNLSIWTVDIVCPDCLEKQRMELSAWKLRFGDDYHYNAESQSVSAKEFNKCT